MGCSNSLLKNKPKAGSMALYSGHLSVPGLNEEDLPKTKVNVFISSTFDDTKFEQDVLLQRVYPRLRDFCRSLGLVFDVVSMRWGVLARSGDEHLTSELCMSQLEMCKRESVGLCFLTLQGYRYGYRPFPSMILKEEMDRIIAALQDAGKSTALLGEPHWRLDETAEPQVYVLQRISSQPGCSKYLLSEEDKKRGDAEAALGKEQKETSSFWWSLFEQVQVLMSEEDDKKRGDAVVVSFKEQRGKEQREASGAWWKLFEQMQVLLREGADAAGLRREERDKYFISVTHDEVNRGIINNSKANEQALCFVRNINGGAAAVRAADLSDDKGTGRMYAEEGEPLNLQEQLKTNVLGVLLSSSSNFIESSVPWVQGGLLHKGKHDAPDEWQAYLTQFGERVESEAKRMILSDYREPIRDALLQEVLNQRRLVVDKLKSQGFGREEVVAQLVDFSDENHHLRRGGVTVLHGSSGAGKSWLMCKTISVLRDTLPSEAVLVYRLLGTTRDSSDAFSLIKSLVAQISFAFQGQGMRGSSGGVDHVPSSWSAASEWFASGKAFEGLAISKDAPLVIVLDSLDQLSLQYQATSNLGAWLPGLKYALPPHVHMILSTLPKEKGIDILSSLEATDSSSSICRGMMRLVQVLPLDVTVDAIQAMVQARPAFGTLLPLKRRLNGDLAELVLQLSSSSKTPLFLALAINIVCQWPSYKACDEDVLVPFRQAAAAGVRGLVYYIFAQLEERHGKLLVHRMLGLLTAAKEGLSELELEDLLSCDDEVLNDVFEWWEPPVRRLPPMLVHRVVSDLQAYLVQRGAGGGKVTVLNWYHRQFWEVATERYLGGSQGGGVDDAKKAHELLARYFGNLLDPALVAANLIQTQPVCLTKTRVWWKEAQVNARRCIEAPHHMIHAGMLDVAVRELCDIERICAYVKAQEGFALVKHLMDLERRITMGSVEAERLNHYKRWLLQDMSTIVTDPAYWLVATCNGSQPLCSIAYQDMSRYLQETSGGGGGGGGGSGDARLHFTDKAWNRSRVMGGGQEQFSALLLSLSGHAGTVSSVSWSPDGTKLASASGDKTVRIWDADTGSQLAELKGHLEGVFSVAWSRDGSKLASASWDKTVLVWDTHTGLQLAELKGHAGGGVTSVAWSPDGAKLASASSDATLRVWDAHTGSQLVVLKNGHHSSQGVNCCCVVGWSPDGSKLASASSDKSSVRVWDARTGSQLAQLQGHSEGVNCVCWSLDGTKIASASDDNTIRVWDARTCSQLLQLQGHSSKVNSVYWSPDGTKLASASGDAYSTDNTVRVWDAHTGSQLAELHGHSSGVTSVNWSRDGSKLASASYDQTVRVWDAHTSSQHAQLKGHSSYVNSVSWSPDGTKLASASEDKTVRLWNAHTGSQLLQLEGHSSHVNSVAWSRDGSKLASGSDDKSVRILDAHTGLQLAELQGHFDAVNSVAWSPDGTKLSSASTDKTVRVWDGARTGSLSQLAELQGHSEGVHSVSWSPDGTKLASASSDKTVRVWDARTCLQLAQLQGHDDAVRSVAWSPDGFKLASASDDKSVRVWDAHSGSQLLQLQGHSSGVRSVSWSLVGAKLASASGDAYSTDNTVRVWDTHTGSQLAVLKGHSDQVMCAAWSPDGTKLASTSEDKMVRVWYSVLDI